MSELLHLRPSQRTFWIGLAVSYHLLRDYERALKVLSGYEDTVKVGGSASLLLLPN